MARRLKELITRDLESRLDGVTNALMVDLSRLTAEETRDYRTVLRQAGISVNVVKNSLVRRVLGARGFEFPAAALEGPTAVLVGGEDAITTSKLVAEWRRKNKKEMPIKGGLLEGETLGPAAAEQLVNMPSAQETRAMLVSVIAAPLSQLVGVAQSILAGVPGVLQAIADERKEEGE